MQAQSGEFIETGLLDDRLLNEQMDPRFLRSSRTFPILDRRVHRE
jgi:hypothetical protein